MSGCTVAQCYRVEYARTLCVLHYHRARRAGTLDVQPRRKQRAPQRPCIVEGCGQAMHARNYCYRHYEVLRTVERLLRKRRARPGAAAGVSRG